MGETLKILRRLLPIAVCGLLVTPLSSAQATNPDVEHLPDLRTQTPSQMRIDTASGNKLLRFSNTVMNLGDGRLELRPQNSAATGVTQAFQGIYSHTAGGTWYRMREQQVGTFAFHSAHNHWHFGDFARYELLALAPDGGPGASLKVSQKTTFCLIDTTQVGGKDTPHAGPRSYTVCNQSSTTGISVAWADRYGYNLADQWVDITGVPDGTYWLMSTVNYDRRLLETDTTNNAGMVKVQVVGNTVTVPGAPPAGEK